MRTLLALAMATLSFAVAVPAHAQLATAPNLTVQNASAEPAGLSGTSRVTARILNPSSQTVVVSGVTSPLAGQTRLLVYGKDANGFQTITEQTTLSLPPGETLLLPNVLEVRLLNLTQPLTTGTEVPLQFHFPNGTIRTTRATIKSY